MPDSSYVSHQEEAHARGLKEGAARKMPRLLTEREKRERLGLRYKAAVGLVKRLVRAVDACDAAGWLTDTPTDHELNAAIAEARRTHRI